MSKIDFDTVVKIVRAAGVHAYVEQTGGGTATIFAGAQRHDQDYGTRYAAVAGPGWFEGPAWTVGTGDSDDLYVGADDDGENMPVVCHEVGAHDEYAVAALIVAQATRDDVTTSLSITAAQRLVRATV